MPRVAVVFSVLAGGTIAERRCGTAELEVSAPGSDAAVARLEFRILGWLEVLREGALVEVGPRKLRALLALLVLNADRVVSADRLIEELWAGRPPSGAAKTLRSYISRLRAVVGGDVLRSRPPGYVLAIEPEQVDARRFERLLTEGRRARARGDPTKAAASLRQALALWHGAALADLADEPFASVEARRLEELRLEALEERIEADLDCGRHHELTGELEALLSEQPLRERLWAQLMTALYRSGRQADALAAYQRARGLLADEFGLETGEELRALEQKILRQELEAGPASTPARQLPGGTVTLLLTDIAGSTRLQQELGEGYVDMLAEHRRVLRAVFSRHGGVEVETHGDRFFVAFARASEAVAAAREAQEALGPGTPRVRIGVHTGEPILTDEGYVGIEVHRATRIMSAASGGQVLLSQTTRELLDETVAVCDLGEHRLKDLTEPQRLYQLGDIEFPPLRTLHRTNLPVQVTSFVGREREREELIRLLPETPLVTLTGLGGCGKTRLALEAAASALSRFLDGVVVVELAGLTKSELVMHAVASQLKAEQRSERPLLEIIADHLRPQALLLVLDNCEHLLDGCAEVVARLLRDCPRVRILATSREPLALPGELVYRVPPLSVTDTERGASSDAVRLFVERASVGGRKTDWSRETLATVASICRELDGLPLAVELAAARTNVLSVQEIAARLDDRFRFLRYWRRGAEPRHETLGATMAWSYDLLSDDERALLRRLSIFAGGFTLDAATAVCLDGDADAALTLLSRLIDASLVLAEPVGDRTRYRMLETVRHYALERLDEAGEEDETRGRHAAYFIEFARRHCWDWQPGETPWAGSWWAALEDDDNLRTALAWYIDRRIADASMRFVCWLTWFWGSTNRIAEGRLWCERALNLNGEADAKSRAYGLLAAGMLSRLADDLARARPCIQQSLDLFLQLGDEFEIAIALRARAALHFISGELDASRADFEAALERFTDLARPWGVASAQHGLAQVYRDLGDRETARSLLSSALEADRRYPSALHSLGDLELDDGDLVAASRCYRESLSLQLEVGAGEVVVVYCLAGLSCVAAARGDAERAGRLWGAVERLEDKRGFKMNHVERVRYEQLIANVALNPTFEEAASVGRDLPLEQVLDYARSSDSGDLEVVT
jgi:predicted ATPase/DNA-binding SARP family transcriptional activator